MNMIDNIIKEVQERTRSQVVTSFIIVFIVKHWETLLRSFDLSITMDQRIEFLREISHGPWYLNLWPNFVYPLLLAFLLTFVFHGAITVGKLITDLWATVWWPKLRDKTLKGYVERDRYDDLYSRHTKLKKDYTTSQEVLHNQEQLENQISKATINFNDLKGKYDAERKSYKNLKEWVGRLSVAILQGGFHDDFSKSDRRNSYKQAFECIIKHFDDLPDPKKHMGKIIDAL